MNSTRERMMWPIQLAAKVQGLLVLAGATKGSFAQLAIHGRLGDPPVFPECALDMTCFQLRPYPNRLSDLVYDCAAFNSTTISGAEAIPRGNVPAPVTSITLFVFQTISYYLVYT